MARTGKSNAQVFSKRKDLPVVNAEQIAGGKHAYERHFTQDGRTVFTRFLKSHLASDGTLNNAEHLNCKRSLVALEHKVLCSEIFGLDRNVFGTLVYGYSPSSKIWTVRACLYGMIKNLGDCGWIPSFDTLEGAFKGAAAIYQDPELFQQLLWQCSNYHKIPVARPFKMVDYSECLDRCDQVRWGTEKHTFVHADDGAVSDEEFIPSSSDEEDLPAPVFEESSSSSSSEPPKPKRRVKRKRSRKPTKSQSKRSKTFRGKNKTAHIETDVFGTVKATYNSDDVTFEVGGDYKDQDANIKFAGFEMSTAFDKAPIFARALQVTEVFDEPVQMDLVNPSTVVIKVGDKFVTISENMP
jgi:hypothetical protein